MIVLINHYDLYILLFFDDYPHYDNVHQFG